MRSLMGLVGLVGVSGGFGLVWCCWERGLRRWAAQVDRLMSHARRHKGQLPRSSTRVLPILISPCRSGVAVSPSFFSLSFGASFLPTDGPAKFAGNPCPAEQSTPPATTRTGISGGPVGEPNKARL